MPKSDPIRRFLFNLIIQPGRRTLQYTHIGYYFKI